MTFFYDLNKKLDSIRDKPEVTHKQLNERDEGKPGKNFAKIAKDAGERYGSKAAGERVAGAVRNKLRDQGKLEEEGMSRAAKGYEKYGKEGMEALAKAGREGKALDPVRKKYDKYDNTEVDEGMMDTVKSVGKKVASGVNRLVGHGSDEDMRRDVQRKAGVPQTGKKPEQKTTEAAKYRDPKYKDKLYTVEPLDYTYGPDADELYYNPKPDDYEGRKRKIGGGEFSHNDPLRKGFGRGGASNSINTHGKRKGLPSRDQITSLKGSIKDAHGTHAEPNLPEAGAPMTAKQKSFAKLAPPTDKITFADKIAGAKKEVDEMLGDVAAEAMRKALGGGKGRNAEMDEENDFTAHKRPAAVQPKVGSTERGHKHDIKHTATGRMVTRRTDAQGNSVGADDDTDTQAGPRGRGRPKGTTGAIGAKGPSGKSKLMTREGDNESSELKAAMALLKKSGYKVTKAKEQEQELDEKAVSKQQQKFMGMAHAMQKGEKVKGASKELKKVAKTMKPKDTEDFAKTKHKGLPDKVSKKKEEEVEESSTTAGSVAPSTAIKSSKGSMIGKGIYDSMNFELEQMIAESMNINMSDSTEGDKSLTVTATDEDALKLGMMLKNAGLGGGDTHGGDMHSHGEESCPTCGSTDCGCGDIEQAVDENAPDYPTNTETAQDNFGYAGGLNKPKASGMATIPVTDVQVDGEDKFATPAHEDALRRMMEMAGLAEAAKPDFLDMDKDGDKKEPMKDAAKDKEEDTVEESIRRMMEIAGVKKKPMDEEKTDEGNKFAFNVLKAKEAGKKEADLDGDGDMEKVRESIFALDNQWQAYKG
jgi:Protein of unknwon function (DUF3008)